MTQPEHLPPSPEVGIEQLRRQAAELSDLALDELIAATTARRNVHGAYGHAEGADLLHRLVVALADVRAMRVESLAEMAEITCPVTVLRVERPGADVGDE